MEQGPYRHDQYSYDSYDAPARGLLEKILGGKAAAKLKSPLFATVALIAVAGIFAAVIAGSYSSAKNGDDEQVPIVRADAERFVTEPETPGGMEVPYKDSTVFNTASQNAPSGNIENLLAPSQEPVKAMTKEEAIGAVETPAPDAQIAEVQTPDLDQSSLEAPSAAPVEEIAASEEAASGTSEVAIKQQIEKIPPQEIVKAAASEATPARPETLHAAGDSPETLDFVRSVLKQKDAELAAGQKTASAATSVPSAPPVAAPPAAVTPAPVAPPPAEIEPAAGMATPSAASPGGYFVQVASVPAASAAAGEWGKMQKTLTMLQGKQYRVQEASVTGKGTMYRIQAGPMNKDQATSLCDSIKAQKPGGCLVVH